MLGLHSHPSGVINSVEQHDEVILRQVLVSGFSTPLPISVVINDEDPTDRQARKKMNQLMPGRFIPIGVESQERDLLRRRTGKCIFDFPLMNFILSGVYPVLTRLPLTSSRGTQCHAAVAPVCLARSNCTNADWPR